MASSLVLRRITNPIRSVAVAPRFFGSQVATVDDDDRRVDSDRRSRSGRPVNRNSAGSPVFFSDVFDPFSPTRSLNQMLNLVDQLMDVGPINAGVSPRRGWDVTEEKDVLHLRMDMPGVDKENVKISVDKDTLIIKGEAEKESEDDEHGRRYSSRLDLPEKVYKVGEIKAEMKNGVLKIKIPKVTEEERKDVFEVKID